MAGALILEALLCMPARRLLEKKPDGLKEQPV
jgi:hypothetical protein